MLDTMATYTEFRDSLASYYEANSFTEADYHRAQAVLNLVDAFAEAYGWESQVPRQVLEQFRLS